MKVLLIVVTTWKLLRRFGGPGLIVVGLVDSLLVPLPASADVLTIVLASHQRSLWPYYGLMATIGSVAGGYLTYRMARKGGQEALEKRFSKRKTRRVYTMFERWGFGSVFIPAMLPPPAPFVLFLVTAGALNYPAKRFIAALALGRAIRFMLVAYLAARFGHRILRFLDREYNTILWTFVAAAVAMGCGFGVYFILKKIRKKRTTGVWVKASSAKAER